ncbi:MAG: hypothetical protein OEL78_00125 [Hyphomicrobiales bacterium]|nr:hypothetical protein [Hyphomicrobiales bacterium]
MTRPLPPPWRFDGTASAFRILDGNGQSSGIYVYFEDDEHAAPQPR